MTYLLFEKPFVPVAILVAAAIVCRVLWSRTEKPLIRNLCFGCFGLAVVWMGTAMLVKTPRERLVGQCQRMARDLAVCEFSTLEQMLSDPVKSSLVVRPVSPAETVAIIEDAVREYQITSITIKARRVEVAMDNSRAMVQINVSCASETALVPPMVWVLSLEDRDRWWVITEAEGYAPNESPEAE